MLDFKPIDIASADRLGLYYRSCHYRLCEYSIGVKLMWYDHWTPEYAESSGCLIVLNHSRSHGCLFDFPVPLPGKGDVSAALDEIDAWCMEHAVCPTFGVVPQEGRNLLLDRYPSASVKNDRLWQDYIYPAENLSSFSGRRYSGQRNHINKFYRIYPQAEYHVLTPGDMPALERFWNRFHEAFTKNSVSARKEVCYAWKMMNCLGQDWVRAGSLRIDGDIVAISLGEVCGDTLICHIEKALSQYDGIYPAMVQAFAGANADGIQWINREDDAGDMGLRASKLQYLPCCLDPKYRIIARNELFELTSFPTLLTERLTLDALTERDIPAYNRLCLDDERNRWWGYDYRDDLQGELTEDYFFQTARQDFEAKQCLNFAIRLDGQLIGEAVLYRFNCRGSAELGCRILPEFSGHGYGTEAFQKAASWSLYSLGLARLQAKCFRENEASRRMLESCMRVSGSDECFLYFEKVV